MGFKLKIEGDETVELGFEAILNVKYETDTPDDSNARATDVGSLLVIEGRILIENAGETLKLAKWSLVPAEEECYRKATVEVIAEKKTIRKYILTEAFVVDYIENFADTGGTGKFLLTVKQKRDKNKDVEIDGGFSA